MKLYVGQIVNHGELKINAETESEQTAKVNYHTTCADLWNEPTVYDATVSILDEQMNIYQKYTEFITHPEPEPTPEPEPETEEKAEES